MKDQIDTRERIIHEAIQCFYEMEYNKVTLNEIAKRAKVTKGGIYHYFDSKDDLFIQALNFTFKDISNAHIMIFDNGMRFQEQLKSFLDLENIIKIYSEFDQSGANDAPILQFIYLMFMAFKKEPRTKEVVTSSYRAINLLMSKRIHEAQEYGEVRKDLNPEIVALQIATIFEGLMMYLAIDSEMQPKQISKELYENLWAQIRV